MKLSCKGTVIKTDRNLIDIGVDKHLCRFNTIHPVPPFDNMTAFNAILDRMEDLGLYLMYDMRQ